MIRNIKKDSENNFYIGGSCSNEFILDGVVYYQDSGYSSNSFLVKFNSFGDIQNVEIFPGVTWMDFYPDNENNLYVFGSYHNQMRIRQILFNVDTCYRYNCEETFAAKLDNQGTCSWAQKKFIYGTVALNSNGDFYVSGSFTDSITIDSVSLFEPETRSALFVYKFNKNGTALWAQKNSGGYYSDCWPYDIDIKNNLIVIAGSFHNNYSQCWFGNDTLPLSYNTHIFLAKMFDTTNSMFNSSQQAINPTHNSIYISPNPATSTLTIQSDHPLNQISLYNTLGEKIFSSGTRQPGTNYMQPATSITLSSQPKGIYFLEVITDDPFSQSFGGQKREVKKIVLE